MTFHICIFQDDSGQCVKGRRGDKSGSEKPGRGHGNDLEKRHTWGTGIDTWEEESTGLGDR